MSTGMFLGEHFPRLDDKGRLILPAKFRERLAEGLVVTKGQERCLYVYPVEEFTQIALRYQTGPTSSKAVRDLGRMLLSGASEEVPDRQGRVTIPASLRAYAGLDRDVAVVGMGARVEIWNADAWTRYVEVTEATYAETNEEVHPGVF
jgi:MraZ protein